MQARISAYSAQVADAVAADPHTITSPAQFQQAIDAAYQEAVTRAGFVKSWLDCERAPGGADKDGDGVPWCNDCNDGNAAVRPGTPEVCGNKIDDNCDGQVDEGC